MNASLTAEHRARVDPQTAEYSVADVMALVTITPAPLVMTSPANAPFTHHTWLYKVETEDQAAAMLNDIDLVRYAVQPDEKGRNALMCQMAVNKHADCATIMSWWANWTHIPDWVLNQATVQGLNIGMIGIMSDRADALILPFLRHPRFDVSKKDSKTHDVLWYAAYTDKVQLIQAIYENPMFQRTMFTAACEIAAIKGSNRAHARLLHLMSLKAVEHIDVPLTA